MKERSTQIRKSTIYLILVALCIPGVGCSSNPVAPEEEELYRKTVERIASTDFERELIEQAESYYPPRDSVLAVVFPWLHDTIPQTGYWWWGTYDGVYLPFALTSDAIEYYESFINELRLGQSNDYYITASLEYKAEVSYYDAYDVYEEGHTPPMPEHLVASFEDVYVVHMQLSFGFECYVHCLLGAGKTRTVVFDQQGNLVFVYGDGQSAAIVA